MDDTGRAGNNVSTPLQGKSHRVARQFNECATQKDSIKDISEKNIDSGGELYVCVCVCVYVCVCVCWRISDMLCIGGEL